MYGGRTSNYNHSHHHHHHYPNHHHHHKGGTAAAAALSPESALAADIFEQFIAASTFKSVLHHYRHMCDVLRLRPQNIRHFYPKLKNKIRSWKAQALWTKFDKRASHKCYNHGKACTNTKVLIIGAGPCGLRSAIEAQLLGAKVVVVEKRDRFSRNNVLHLWPFVIADLKALGAKKFYGKFCAGAIDHISIRQLQCILLKVALLLGVEVFEGVTFDELLEPPEDQSQNIGWHARFSPAEHPVNQYEFDVLIGADGKRNTLTGFKRKEFRGKLAIAITANFINKHSEQEARVQEISGVAFIFNQKFFKDLYSETGIDLENIVYYKDETHYFVMTAKKHSLIDKGVILRDLPDTQQLLHPNNVDRQALCSYAREAADFSTAHQMPHLDFAVNHYGKPDIAMFDFTSMFAAENACRVLEKNGHKLLQCLVGDSLLEPFWPTGSGCARGFLSSLDACWAIRSWSSNNKTPLEVIAERESIYRLLAQTTPENLSKDYSSYTLEPSSRYPTVNLKVLLSFQVRHLYLTDDPDNKEFGTPEDMLDNPPGTLEDVPRKRKRRDSIIQPDTLLSWCQKQVAHNENIKIEDLSHSFKDGRAFCIILHRYRPDLLDVDSLNPSDHSKNCQLAFDIFENEFSIPPKMSGEELANSSPSEHLDLVSYISHIHDALRGEIPHSMGARPPLKALKGQSLEGLDLEDFPDQPKIQERERLLENNMSSSSSISSKNIGKFSCRILEEPKTESVSKEDLQKTKKRRNELGSLDKMNEVSDSSYGSSLKQNSEEFSDRVKGLEAKFRGDSASNMKQKPKDMIRAIGKLEKTDWNISAIEKKIEENPKPSMSVSDKEKVPKWTRDNYNDKYQNIERRLRENGEDEERIAKYLDIDASLKRLERKLREGSTLETGLRGHNKVSNLANQLSSKLVRKDEEKEKPARNAPRTMVLPTSGSDLCYFCGTRVYLVERLSAEGKFFHRQCFKCSYCGALLRLGNYIYDRENRYGGKFFCIPHFGATVRSRAPAKKKDQVSEGKEVMPNPEPDTFYGIANVESGVSPPFTTTERISTTGSIHESRDPKGSPHLLSPPSKVSSPLDRGTTPERVEFENSVIEHSDEEEYLSEDEWTDRNFGASANELDDEDDDEDSDYSDLSDEEVDEEVLLENQQKLTVDETRRLAESWKRRYSNDVLEMSDDQESFSDSDNDGMSEHGAEGDESRTPTEGEAGDDDDDDEEEGDDVRRARELRKLELNINVEAPPRKAETSDSGSETEVGSDEESDTQIDTDSEFADDQECQPPKEIPTIVIDEMPKDAKDEDENKDSEPHTPTKLGSGGPAEKYVAQIVEMNHTNEKEGTERSASMSNLVNNSQFNGPNPHTEHLRRLLQRTESSELVSAQKNQLRRQYLLGNTTNMPRKSVSTADLGNRFKSFMDKISETQKKLNPAPQPSPAMQAFLSISNKSNGVSANNYISKDSVQSTSSQQNSTQSTNDANLVQDVKKLDKEVLEIKEKVPDSESDSSSKSEEGKLITFSNINNKELESCNKRTESSSICDANNVASDVVMEEVRNNQSPEEESKGEKGTLDSEQSEKNIMDVALQEESILSDFCVSAKNINFIEEFNGNEAKNLDLIKAFSDGEVKDYELEASFNENKVEAVNLKLINNENLKNASTDILCETENNDDDDVDADFDQLADDAIKELNRSELSPVVLESINKDFIGESECDTKDKNSNLKGDNNQQPINLEKKQDESGFKSLEDNKSLSSNEVNNYPSTSGEKRILEKKESCLKQEEILSPEAEAVTTEADLSDWADDNDALSINAEEFETDFRKNDASSNLKGVASSNKAIARIASLESLGDSDSAISVSMSKVAPETKPSPFNELDGMEYMDTSGSESSPDEVHSVSIKYNVLQDCTPTSPPSEKLFQEPVSSNSFAFLSNSNVDKLRGPTKSKSLDIEEEHSDKYSSNRSLSEPPPNNSFLSMTSATESSTLESPPSVEIPQMKSQFTKRYEGYIPRFKDRVTPFSSARDSLDVRKNSTPKPLFTPSKEDILQREKNEAERLKSCSTDSSQNSPVSLSTSSSSKVKDGDLVKDMVMSRITKKVGDRGRRGSRNALHLSLHSSTSSIFGSEPSLDTSKTSFSANQGSLKEDSPLSDTPRDLRNLNNSVPSEEKHNTEEFSSDINSSNLSTSINKLSINSPVEKKDEFTSRNLLPATPLTHPEKFKEDSVKRELFKSTPQLSQYTSSNPQFVTVFGYHPPPNGYSQRYSEIPSLYNQNVNLSKSLVNNAVESPQDVNINKYKEKDLSLGDIIKNDDNESFIEKPPFISDEKEEPSKKDPEERVKELLEERRRKESEDQREVRLRNKDSCVQECLEEYRQKRSSAPVFTQSQSQILNRDPKGNMENVQTRAQLGLGKKHFHRPSLLELESMQIFSSSRGTQENAPPSNESASISPKSINLPSSANVNTTPSSEPSVAVSPASTETPPEKKSTKKSKDRERRRSLIQVVAGMFSKSDEKKKEKDKEENDVHSKDKGSDKVSPHVTETNPVPPKSPSVKERFSKLRLSRSKEKKKSPSDQKNRSASVDINPGTSSEPKQPTNSLSLPTSPSRTIFSFLSSSPAKFHDKGKSSTSEENNSEDETTYTGVGNTSKDSTLSTPSLRRQRAALRAAKQAEQKRLRMAQEIQRQLEECEVKTRELEEKGIGVEKALIGETDGSCRDSSELMKEWFNLVHEKNTLVRWQEELTVKARELELEDRHVRLENELRQRMTSSEREKTREDIEREGQILAEIISIIEQKDALVNLLEKDRQRCDTSVSKPIINSHETPLAFASVSRTNIDLREPFKKFIALFDLFFVPSTQTFPRFSPHLPDIKLSKETLISYQGKRQPLEYPTYKRKPSVFDKCLFPKPVDSPKPVVLDYYPVHRIRTTFSLRSVLWWIFIFIGLLLCMFVLKIIASLLPFLLSNFEVFNRKGAF